LLPSLVYEAEKLCFLAVEQVVAWSV
jgi:hypothetical protein